MIYCFLGDTQFPCIIHTETISIEVFSVIEDYVCQFSIKNGAFTVFDPADDCWHDIGILQNGIWTPSFIKHRIN